MSYGVRSSVVFAALGLVGLGFPASSSADVQHVVARGHTVEAIAHRYHVTAKSILDANHIKDAKHLKVGETLTIPGVSAKDFDKSNGKLDKSDKSDKSGKPAKPVTFAMRPKTPGVVHATRLATSEDFTVRVADRRGKQSPVALKTFEKMLRSAGGQTHPIEPHLLALVAIVSNHFGSRKLEVVSGFRPYTPTQHTAHSNHNVGKAIDFRVAGVPNEVLRDYCRTLKNVGVGYYPNSTFVHIDVRPSSAFWIDYSKPGEPPRYNSADVDADEGTSDVAEESHLPDPAMAADPTPAPAAQDLPMPATTPAPSATTSAPAAPSAPAPSATAPTAPSANPTPALAPSAPVAPSVAPTAAPTGSNSTPSTNHEFLP